MVVLGRCIDGRELAYDTALYEFRLARELASFQDVRALDSRGHIRWLAPEQHDWFVRINPDDLRRCNRRALAAAGEDRYADMSPEERVKADAARDDSVLAGKIVDADPVLVQAVAAKLEEQGLLKGGGTHAMPANPLAMVDLPRGMEALSQFERHQGANRKMTSAEKRLMKKILKNADKEKARREKRGEIEYTDSQGNPIQPEEDAVRPDEEQVAVVESEEARALNEMRERNRERASSEQSTNVPGMEKSRRARRNDPFGSNAAGSKSGRKR